MFVCIRFWSIFWYICHATPKLLVNMESNIRPYSTAPPTHIHSSHLSVPNRLVSVSSTLPPFIRLLHFAHS